MGSPEAIPNRRLAATVAAPLPESVGEGTRRTALQAALGLFAEKGYAGTSVRDIAAAIHVKPATLYSHFPSKSHILAELVNLGHDAQMQAVRAELLNSQPDPRVQIVAYMRGHVSAHARFAMLCIVANAELHALEGELAAPALEKRQFSEQLLRDIVDRGVAQGVFDVPDAWLAGAAIGGMGLRVAYWYTPEIDHSIDEIASTYGLYALRILGVSEPFETNA